MNKACAVASVLVFLSQSSLAMDIDTQGNVSVEQRMFTQTGTDQNKQAQFSVSWNQEFHKDWNDKDMSFMTKLFARYDNVDDERTHMDIRELSFQYFPDMYEVKVGISKEFWGVTESQHLVDVINQTDLVEAIDEEEKLGQPMLKVSLARDWGLLESFILPYFRERTFVGEEGRLRTPLPVSKDSLFESSQGKHHTDFALRYSHMIDAWDIGLSYFDGTNRQAQFIQQGDLLIPIYYQMTQWGLDLQAIYGGWMYKLEAIRRSEQTSFHAITTGFEYTEVGVFDSNWDLGWLAELLYDSRGQKSDSFLQKDVYVGMRAVANDVAGTEILLGMAKDLDSSASNFVKLEAFSRINNHWKWRVEAFAFNGSDPDDPLASLKRDDFLQFSLEYYF